MTREVRRELPFSGCGLTIDLMQMSNESRIRVELYESRHKTCWDEFVRQSKNGVFMFYRDYLEYHADRFNDFSLLFFQNDRLIALMPGNRVDDTVVSHGGLTFGGIVSDSQMTTPLMLRVFAELVDDLRARDIRKLIYKATPHMYHILPAEEDLYALFVHNARLVRRDVATTVIAGRKLPLARSRRKILKRAQSQGLKVVRSSDYDRFMSIARDNLQMRHGVLPVHTAAEMQLLESRFPENIKLFTVEQNGEMLGGLIIYESQMVAHGQYRNATAEGLRLGALDLVMDVLLSDVYTGKPYRDFGISTTENGRTLNAGLIQNKESYGGRAMVYDFYELSLET
ncbi:MAG: GNAT family N-acetyltransferase [Terracidiphilus sp.]